MFNIVEFDKKDIEYIILNGHSDKFKVKLHNAYGISTEKPYYSLHGIIFEKDNEYYEVKYVSGDKEQVDNGKYKIFFMQDGDTVRCMEMKHIDAFIAGLNMKYYEPVTI